MPLHSKARQFAASGFFIGITSFEELEKRISSISENKQKGDAFEVFAEAYIATQRIHEIRQAWPLDTVPLDLLRRLKLPIKDYGVDGITETILGGHQVYQVKFRSNRTPLNWEELSTFMGLSDSPEIQSKIVITNSDDLPEVINERHNFFCIRGSDLDRLTVGDFRVIEAWISGASLPPRERHAPREHQQEALDRILPALSTHDRVSVIMACGTGKTLVTLWTAEQVGFRTILVLLPSLALLRQMLHEWKDQADMKFAPLCVCSDPSVKGEDAISTAQSDLDFEVSTNTETVRRFLDAPFDGTKVVFCTYQSAKVVGSAMKPNESFDLGIFDEAHKTAGREGRNYGYALEDKNLRISKRLFVTATPRHYDPSKRNKEGEAAIAFSMDNQEVYGPQVYTLPFSEAARRGIICNYKVIISVISSEQVNDETLSRGTVEVQGDEIRARQVANQISLRDAVSQYGVSKIFTFHSTVKSAASFTNDGSEGVRTHLSRFATHHVSGAMPTAKRERIMREFRAEERAVISNARCLTEGVDVPAVDMVAFLSPRKSKVDIVQAIGRAMRRSGDKEVGYVLVPLYLEQNVGESMVEAISRAHFEEVWDILQSLQEQDEVLAELIRDMAVAKGRGKGFDDSRFSERIDFIGPVLALESIRDAVTTRVLERLESSWEINYGNLIRYKTEHGDCNVPEGYSEIKGLYTWVCNQRSLKKKNALAKERIETLNGLEFSWNPLESKWDTLFEKLKKYKASYGDCRVSQLSSDYKKLGHWITRQRNNYSKGLLNKIRITQLEKLGIEWDILVIEWDLMFEELKKYRNENGHCIIPTMYEKDKKLGTWAYTQRFKFRKGKLSLDCISKLESVGLELDPYERAWQDSFESLKKYREENSDCRVPQKYKKDALLGKWVSTQRVKYAAGKITEKRIKQLESLGFEWDLYSVQWDEMFSSLLEFKKEKGNCRVPNRYKNDKALGGWVSTQRKKYKLKKITSEHIAKLESIGFDWS
jgi:superfamily II DNA or RNA helicase